MWYSNVVIFMKFKKVYVEITNNCNLKCSFCNEVKRRKEFLNIEDFKGVLKKINGYTDYLYLHLMGEPLLHPQINEFIDLAAKKYKVNITTNGYLIDKIKNNKNIRQINISLHSYISNSKSLEEYLENIVNTCDVLNKNGTIINYRIWTTSEYTKNIVDYFNNYYKCDIKLKKGFKIRENVFLDIEDEFIWPDLSNDYCNEEGTCRALKDHIGILVDGTIVPCCLDTNGIINLGNIYANRIDDIINSDMYKNLLNGFNNNKKIHNLCQKCSFYDRKKHKRKEDCKK